MAFSLKIFTTSKSREVTGTNVMNCWVPSRHFLFLFDCIFLRKLEHGPFSVLQFMSSARDVTTVHVPTAAYRITTQRHQADGGRDINDAEHSRWCRTKSEDLVHHTFHANSCTVSHCRRHSTDLLTKQPMT